MNPGSYRFRLTIERPVAGTANEYNEMVTTWTPFVTIWASIAPSTPRESEYAKRFSATVSHTIETRYVPGVKPTMRVNYGGRIFTINGVINDRELNQTLVIYATEIV